MNKFLVLCLASMSYLIVSILSVMMMMMILFFMEEENL